MKDKNKSSSLEEELPIKTKKKKSLTDKVFEYIKPQTTVFQRKAPLTFNVALSVALIFVYLSVAITVGPLSPIILIFVLPVLYILARQVKLEREFERRFGEKDNGN